MGTLLEAAQKLRAANGEHYISMIDGNTYSPEAYPAGWEKQ